MAHGMRNAIGMHLWTWTTLAVASLCWLPLYCSATSASAHFLHESGALESLSIAPSTLRGVAPREQRLSSTSLVRDGWVWRPNVDRELVPIVRNLGLACRTSGDSAACAKRYFAARPAAAAAVLRAVEAALRSALPHSLTARCSASFVTFARAGATPQNMHYDTVAQESRDCRAITPALGRDGMMSIRAWLPTAPVDCAQLLLANTTALYTDACAKRASAKPRQSASWKIFSRAEFEKDCAAAVDSRACSWFTTDGMTPGEMLFFRNGFVMHGTNFSMGGCKRMSLAVDCTTSSAKGGEL